MAGSSRTEVFQDYVFHDGSWIKEDALIKMAMTAGSYPIAEHYLNSLLLHAVIQKKDGIVTAVNKVREYYDIIPYPTPEVSLGTDRHIPNHTPKKKTLDETAREIYHKMNDEQRRAVLKEAMTKLWFENQSLFYNKTCWIGVYLVIKDRLDGRQTQKGFLDFADGFTPKNWPLKLKISKSTMKNYGRYVKYADREQAYYEMENNPWEELCDTFWCILKSKLQTAF